MHKLFILISLISINTYASNMKNIVDYLASDKLEGRKPGQNGNVLATNFLIQELRKAGLEPLDKAYTQDFTIFTEMIKSGNNTLEINGKKITAFEPISYSLSGDLKNKELVFAGFGISIPSNDTKLKYDDYKGLDVKDKVVVVLTGDPGIGNANSLFRDPDYINYRSLFYKLKNAITHGAAGIILIADPLSNEDYPNEVAPTFLASEGGGNRFSIVAGRLTNREFNKVSGLDTLALQKKIAQTQAPISITLTNKVNLSVNLKKKTGRVSNIVGIIKGSDTELSKEVVVLGGHMDHLGWGGDSSMEPSHVHAIHNGADDNASGTAMVIELAKRIKLAKLKRTYAFVLFNAEEMGLLGSAHFVDMWARYEETYGKMISMLNFDMVGRYSTEVSVMGTDSSLAFAPLLIENKTALNIVPKKQAIGSSDHASFLNKKIPSLFFTTGAHEDYHRSSDTSDKINIKAMEETANYAFHFITKLDNTRGVSFNPNFSTGDNSNGRNRGYGAHLGCVPQFGQSEDIIGVVCVRASEGSPAQSAGIIADDILVQIGDIEINSIYDLAFALKYYRAGDKVELGWKRGNTLMKQIVTLAKSRRH